MSKGTILIILGVLVVIAPFSGLPGTWLDWILPLLGLMVVLSGYLLRLAPLPAEKEN